MECSGTQEAKPNMEMNAWGCMHVHVPHVYRLVMNFYGHVFIMHAYACDMHRTLTKELGH